MSHISKTSEPLLINQAEAARLLNCCTRTIYLLRKARKLPFMRIGLGNQSSIRFYLKDIENFIADRIASDK